MSCEEFFVVYWYFYLLFFRRRFNHHSDWDIFRKNILNLVVLHNSQNFCTHFDDHITAKHSTKWHSMFIKVEYFDRTYFQFQFPSYFSSQSCFSVFSCYFFYYYLPLCWMPNCALLNNEIACAPRFFLFIRVANTLTHSGRLSQPWERDKWKKKYQTTVTHKHIETLCGEWEE